MRPRSHYCGRFAPSPTGALHAGSLVAALASWLDARAHNGHWLVRIEDVDTPRCVKGADRLILGQLAACTLVSDEPVVYQSQRSALYQHALDHLVAVQSVYPCTCSRKDIERAQTERGLNIPRHGQPVYPGICRTGLRGKTARAWRLRTDTDTAPIRWHDRRLGWQQQDVGKAVGDFVLRRADGLWAYQLAVVVDDAQQGITDVVRGADLLDNTPRQILLQRTLGLPQPHYLHTPLVLATDGQKLSKQNGACPIDVSTPANALAALQVAAQQLGLTEPPHDSMATSLQAWIEQWRHIYNRAP